MGPNTVMRSDTDENLFEFIAERADRFGSKTAMLYKPAFRYLRWSYADLVSGADDIASLLLSNGISKGDRVLIWAHNSPQWVMAFFGCLRIGAILVPLDLRSAPDFVRKVVSKTSPKMAFVSRLTPQWHKELGLNEFLLDDFDVLTEGMSPPVPMKVAPGDLAEIMFTSGTTGDPKGVMLTHRNLLSNVEAARQYVPRKPTDRLMSLLPLSHMFEQMGGLILALRVGANITYPTSRQPTVLFRTMRERKVTIMLLVPQAMDLFMKGIEREIHKQGKQKIWDLSMKISRSLPMWGRNILFRKIHKGFGGSLELIFSGGAALDGELGAKWESLGVKIIQGYGATEASPIISCHTEKEPRYDSVGRPIPGVGVCFGKPVSFTAHTSYIEATATIEDAVKSV